MAIKPTRKKVGVAIGYAMVLLGASGAKMSVNKGTTGIAGGILSAWNDCAAKSVAEYERWYVNEHLPERLAVPGFREGRRYEAVPDSGADRCYFTFYEVDSLEVLRSLAYLERLNNPTPATTAIMRHFRNMVRTVCLNASEHGSLTGGHAVTLRFAPGAPAPASDLAGALYRELAGLGAVHVRVWAAAHQQTGATAEARIRPVPDANIGAAVIIESLRAENARDIAEHMTVPAFLAQYGLGSAPATGIYRLLCLLRA